MTPQRSTIPPGIEDAVLTSLQKLPADRFGTAAEFATALEGGRAGGREGGKTTRTIASVPPPAFPPRDTAGLLIALAAHRRPRGLGLDPGGPRRWRRDDLVVHQLR